ncbi:hypothetical protein [Nonomuraea sp. B19D2]|uniref:hypothetical protein n=1 Tax=Nonomuraea sp. B19D2 TaxID=3159561 RepID=UPI0032DB8D0B
MAVAVKNGAVVGMVSRRDLIKVFLRPDTDIERQVREAVQAVQAVHDELKWKHDDIADLPVVWGGA